MFSHLLKRYLFQVIITYSSSNVTIVARLFFYRRRRSNRVLRKFPFLNFSLFFFTFIIVPLFFSFYHVLHSCFRICFRNCFRIFVNCSSCFQAHCYWYGEREREREGDRAREREREGERERLFIENHIYIIRFALVRTAQRKRNHVTRIINVSVRCIAIRFHSLVDVFLDVYLVSFCRSFWNHFRKRPNRNLGFSLSDLQNGGEPLPRSRRLITRRTNSPFFVFSIRVDKMIQRNIYNRLMIDLEILYLFLSWYYSLSFLFF